MRNTQVDWLVDQDGRIAVDWIGRFEYLQDDFDTLIRKLGKNPVGLPHIKKSQRQPYHTYYDAETVQLFLEIFAADLEAFGYTFEG